MTETLSSFNREPEEELRARLSRCCAAESWVERVIDGRPYEDEEELYAVSDEATGELDDEGLRQALAGHPRIGAGLAAPAGSDRAGVWSSQEQAGVAAADADVILRLQAGNADYERRFGHVYLVCATGRSAEELLDICRARLENDPETERRVVVGELAKINRLRLGKLLAESRVASLSTHVLDASSGAPAVGVSVRVETQEDDGWRVGPEHRTDDDGRVSALGSPGPGVHRIRFDTGAYFGARGIETFYPEVTVTFVIKDAASHYHVPLLLSPFAFSTYRGS